MTFGKWNTSGKCTWSNGYPVIAGDLNTTIGEATPPVSSIIGWLKSLSGIPQTLPSGWEECDGSSVSDSDSPLDGQTLPNLNGASGGTQRFLRGNSISGGSDGAATHSHGTVNTNTFRSPGGQLSANVSHLPPYYEVVWIIRIK